VKKDKVEFVMPNLFLPDYLFESIYDIPSDFFSQLDIRAVIFDIDNTLVKDNHPVPDEKAIKYIHELKNSGISVGIVSNNSEERVKSFVEYFGTDISYSYKSGKPKKSSLDTVLRSFGQTSSHVALVGDQILTDIIAAKSNEIIAIYVKPIDTNCENFFFKIKRLIERPFLALYRAKNKRRK